MAAAALNTYITAMTSPEKKNMPPHEQLSTSASLPDQYLLHFPMNSQHQASIAIRWQQQNPQLFNQQLRLRAPHIARRPILPRKACNSWMAFRSFYQNLFHNLPQKTASIYLTQLWKRDCFKAKWSIIAAAYSKIRNTVGKPRAPLDQYLKIICPQMGIVAVDAYLTVFNWTCEKNAEGALVFTQTTTPNLRALDQHTLHSSMTEKDVILFCGSAGYITRSVARRIAGVSRHGLLASAPTVNSQEQHSSTSSSPQIIFQESGYEAQPATPATNNLDYEWTGSMSDLYHPSEGSIDFDRLLRGHQANPWDTTNIHDPQSFDNFVENGGMQDGYLAPIVPDNPESLLG